MAQTSTYYYDSIEVTPKDDREPRVKLIKTEERDYVNEGPDTEDKDAHDNNVIKNPDAEDRDMHDDHVVSDELYIYVIENTE